MKGQKSEFLYFALRNRKLQIGLTILLFFLVLAIAGPLLEAERGHLVACNHYAEG